MGRPTALLRCAKHSNVCARCTDAACSAHSSRVRILPSRLSPLRTLHDMGPSGAHGAVMQQIGMPLRRCPRTAGVRIAQFYYHALGYSFLSPCAQGALRNDFCLSRPPSVYEHALVYKAMSATLGHPGDLGASREGGPSKNNEFFSVFDARRLFVRMCGVVGGFANCIYI